MVVAEMLEETVRVCYLGPRQGKDAFREEQLVKYNYPRAVQDIFIVAEHESR